MAYLLPEAVNNDLLLLQQAGSSLIDLPIYTKYQYRIQHKIYYIAHFIDIRSNGYRKIKKQICNWFPIKQSDTRNRMLIVFPKLFATLSLSFAVELLNEGKSQISIKFKFLFISTLKSQLGVKKRVFILIMNTLIGIFINWQNIKNGVFTCIVWSINTNRIMTVFCRV